MHPVRFLTDMGVAFPILDFVAASSYHAVEL
jgi:hypothetical protein